MRDHDDHFADIGYASMAYVGLVHTPVPMYKAMKIPEARAAMEKERKKLDDKKAWDFNKVQSKAAVKARAQRERKTMHLRNLNRF